MTIRQIMIVEIGKEHGYSGQMLAIFIWVKYFANLLRLLYSKASFKKNIVLQRNVHFTNVTPASWRLKSPGPNSTVCETCSA